jgi:hypothetical protein
MCQPAVLSAAPAHRNGRRHSVKRGGAIQHGIDRPPGAHDVRGLSYPYREGVNAPQSGSSGTADIVGARLTLLYPIAHEVANEAFMSHA